jgi:hypothetical protein
MRQDCGQIQHEPPGFQTCGVSPMGACASPQNEEAHHEDTSWRRDFCASTSGIARKLVPTNPWSKVVIEYSSNGGRMPDHIWTVEEFLSSCIPLCGGYGSVSQLRVTVPNVVYTHHASAPSFSHDVLYYYSITIVLI